MHQHLLQWTADAVHQHLHQWTADAAHQRLHQWTADAEHPNLRLVAVMLLQQQAVADANCFRAVC